MERKNIKKRTLYVLLLPTASAAFLLRKRQSTAKKKLRSF
ncbi:MAG: sortase B protein-sorting domain-containing protein [Saprospiraceae bacterium]|nr:sortase B protein-sorting domain-containing protein [Saprospiraceae bacterium]